MAIDRTPKSKHKPRSPILLLTASIAAISLLYLLSSLNFINGFSFSSSKTQENLVVKSINHGRPYNGSERYLFWGNRIDGPRKHCDSCEGLGHQESSLKCALEEAMFLGRTFVMPSRMCINLIHDKKGILRQSDNATSADSALDRGLQYAKNGSHYISPQLVRRALEPLKKCGISDGEMCMIANVCPECLDGVFALIPSLKGKINNLTEPLKVALSELAKLKHTT